MRRPRIYSDSSLKGKSFELDNRSTTTCDMYYAQSGSIYHCFKGDDDYNGTIAA